MKIMFTPGESDESLTKDSVIWAKIPCTKADLMNNLPLLWILYAYEVKNNVTNHCQSWPDDKHVTENNNEYRYLWVLLYRFYNL